MANILANLYVQQVKVMANSKMHSSKHNCQFGGRHGIDQYLLTLKDL